MTINIILNDSEKEFLKTLFCNNKSPTISKVVNEIKSNLSLYEEIESDKVKPESINKETTNPFNSTKKSKSTWDKSELDSLIYCATTSTPSHKTLDYAMRKVSKERTENAVRRQLYRLGYGIKKGVICKKS